MRSERTTRSCVDTPDARALYTRNLTLVRPDQHVAWRSDAEPAAPLDLMDLVRGARPIPAENRRDGPGADINAARILEQS